MKHTQLLLSYIVLSGLLGCATAPKGDPAKAAEANDSLANEIAQIKDQQNARYSYKRIRTAQGERIIGNMNYTDKNQAEVRKTFKTDENGVFTMEESVEKGYGLPPTAKPGKKGSETAGIQVGKSSLSDGIYTGTILRTASENHPMTVEQPIQVTSFVMGKDLNARIGDTKYAPDAMFTFTPDGHVDPITPVEGRAYALISGKKPAYYVYVAREKTLQPLKAYKTHRDNTETYLKSDVIFVFIGTHNSLSKECLANRKVQYNGKER